MISYDDLVELYWTLIDSTDMEGQIYDHGDNYLPTIFVDNEQQGKIAQASKEKLEASNIWNAPIVVPILDSEKFWPAEAYHQDFFKNNPKRAKSMHQARKCYLDMKKLKGKFHL